MPSRARTALYQVQPAAWDATGQATVPDVTVVIAAYNAGFYLEEAIESVLAQDVDAEIIVVDDASTDDTSEVALRYPEVYLIRGETNRGPSACRNEGARMASAPRVLFLDADDRLLDGALRQSLACMKANGEAAFVYGAHRRVDAMWRPLTPLVLERCDTHRPPDPRLAFLRTNCVGMIATALIDRDKLLAVGGFDESLRRCEDYDLFLSLAERWPVACHEHPVAEYRIHGANTSGDPGDVLHWAWTVQALHLPDDPVGQAAVQQGRREWARAYALAAWRETTGLSLVRIAGQRWRMARLAPAASLIAAATWAARRVLPPPRLRHGEAPADRHATAGPRRSGRPEPADADQPELWL